MFRAILLFKNDWTRYPIGVFKKTSTVSWSSSNDRKVVEKILTFLATSRNFKEKSIGKVLEYTQSGEKPNRCLVSSWSVPSWNGRTLFKKCQTFFHQTSVRFHSAVATLEPQNYAIARTVGTENILLFSGRPVLILREKTFRLRLKKKQDYAIPKCNCPKTHRSILLFLETCHK